MMLSGWKLLNEHCPICHTALLSKNQRRRCPSCDLPVVLESDHRNENFSSSAPLALNSSVEFDNDDNKHYSVNDSGSFASLEDAKKEYDTKNKYLNNISNKLGEKMLCGWTLLNSVCPRDCCGGTPLMRLADKPMLCVACDTEYLPSDLDGPLMAPSKIQLSNQFGATNATECNLRSDSSIVKCDVDNSFFLDTKNAPILDMHSFSSSIDDASSKLSKKMLQGWVLLNQCCVSKNCFGSVPLMKDLKGEVSYCVHQPSLVISPNFIMSSKYSIDSLCSMQFSSEQ